MKKIKASIPNALTISNLSLGIIAILLAVTDSSNNLLIPASLLIIIAALADRFDGKVARYLGTSSEFGKELDSLSDLISFGVAPVIIAWKINFIGFGILGYILALIFPISGAYRLARYNSSEFSSVFKGIPITIAGTFLSINNIFNCSEILKNRYGNIHFYITIILIISLSYLMISNIKIKKI